MSAIITVKEFLDLLNYFVFAKCSTAWAPDLNENVLLNNVW